VRRREFIAGLGSAAAWPLAARAQQRERMRRVGILMPYAESDGGNQTRVRAFRQALAKLGWSVGSNVQLDERWTKDDMDLVRASAANLVELNSDVILGVGDRVSLTLAQLTRSIPIVAVSVSDPVGSGLVASLARPGGNVTGFSSFEFSIVGKSLEALKQIVPGISRVGMIYNPDNLANAVYVRSFETSARQLAVQPINLPIHGLADLERALGTLAEQPNGGLFFSPDVTTLLLREHVTALVARHRVPAIYWNSFYVTSGGLVSYGSDTVELFRQAASYVDRVLRGEKPADLPIQQPTKYRLVINLKTAKALGLTIPETLLATADEVIQ
jgi:putative ABC transport system substrate-binding protein